MSVPQRSLLATLHRGNLKLVLAVMASAWITISIIAYVNLRLYGDQSLKLVAHSIAYTAQAATAFHDAASARETLELIGAQEGLVSAQILDDTGRELGSFKRKADGVVAVRLTQLGDILFPQFGQAEITVDNQVVGKVLVWGSSALYVEFFAKTLAAGLLCLIGVAIAIASLSREVERKIIGPLRQLAALTHVVRLSRQFDRRAPPTGIAEINQLGDDFNALMAEIEILEKAREEHARNLQLVNERLGHEIRHDGLTGLPNRGFFRERLDAEINSGKNRDSIIAVLYVDYDRFKSVNDQFGHAAGDDLLIEAGRRIRSLLRDTDTVARLGGDEFGVLLTNLKSQYEAEHIAQQIVTVMNEPIRILGSKTIVSSVSVGVALFPDHALTLERLLSAADMAMYRAKTEKRNSYRVARKDDDPLVADAQSELVVACVKPRAAFAAYR
jgi:diguanylate cyclase (GGDEF)-like protein